MDKIEIYILECCEHFCEGWEEIGFATGEGGLEYLENQYQLLELYGGKNYRLRKLTIEDETDWSWKVVKSNYETNG